jgi:hypothetical protein
MGGGFILAGMIGFRPRAIGLAGALAVLAGCETPPPPTPQQRSAIEACRSQAEQQFLIQNRAGLYQPNTSLTPYASGTPTFQQVQSLADQYDHRQMVQDCLQGASGPAPVAPTPVGPPGRVPPPPLPPTPPEAAPAP